MIPYFELREIPLGGGYSIAAFGLCVAAGVFAGTVYAQRRADRLQLPEREVPAMILWAVVPGFFLAHVTELLVYQPENWHDLSTWLAFWDGMSSFGGFLGALLGMSIYLGWRRSWLAQADVLVGALVVGWVFGRLGCTLVHDHVGTPSSFPLAIRFPGGP